MKSSLYTVNLTNGNTTQVGAPGSSLAPVPLNAAGFNPLDNFIYAASEYNSATGSGQLFRISADGTAQAVTTISQLGPNVTMDAGDVDASGQWWGGMNNGRYWVQVDLNSRSATYGAVVGSGNVTEDGTYLADFNGYTLFDWTYIPNQYTEKDGLNDTYLWSASQYSVPRDGYVVGIISFNTATKFIAYEADWNGDYSDSQSTAPARRSLGACGPPTTVSCTPSRITMARTTRSMWNTT